MSFIVQFIRMYLLNWVEPPPIKSNTNFSVKMHVHSGREIAIGDKSVGQCRDQMV